MPVETVADSQIHYSLVSYDADGVERPEAGTLFSETIVRAVAAEPITDVILISHGWNGDLPAAREQYQRWITAMLECAADRAELAGRAPGFRPLIVGLHWPSKAWGDEELGPGGSFAATPAGAPNGATTVDALVDRYAALLSGTPRARAALRTIFTAALQDIMPDTMPPIVAQAYAVLDAEIRLGAAGVGARPGSDREPFDAPAAYDDTLEEEETASFGAVSLGGLLAPLRTLTFWHMKRRACQFGESGGAELLRRLQSAAPDRHVRFHLMGHSFGCIVVSASIAGSAQSAARPVDTLVLVQGALSLWSYCDSIPSAPERSGYFHRIVADNLVRGPVVTTMSEHDRAVGFFYPLGALAGRQLSYPAGQFPKYGGVGAFGARGLSTVDDLRLRAVSEPYDFRPGRIYNLESSHVIAAGGGASGAHSDICHPEVAHAVWSAIAATT
jgi:hypothetical protein